MTEVHTTGVSQRWGRKRFLEQYSVKPESTWGIPHDQVRILERVIENWLSASQPISALEFRMKGRSYQNVLEHLDNRHIIATQEDGIYKPTFFGLVVANGQRAKGVSGITSACQKVFAAAKSMFKRNPKNPLLAYDEFQAKTSVEEPLLARSLQLLRDSGLGVGMNGAPGTPQMVYASESVTRYSSIWEYFATMADLRTSAPFSYSQEGGLIDLGAISHFDEILAVVRDGSELVRKAVGQIHNDPAAAITAARSLVEATLKWVLHDGGADSPAAASPAKLVKQCFPHIGLDGGQARRETGIGQMLTGIDTALHGLAKMRDELSDAHGRQPGAPSPSRLQSRLAVGLAVTLSCFIVEAREAHKCL